MFFNDVPIAELVGRNADVITLADANGCSASHSVTVMLVNEDDCIDQPGDGGAVCGGSDAGPPTPGRPTPAAPMPVRWMREWGTQETRDRDAHGDDVRSDGGAGVVAAPGLWRSALLP